MHMNVEVDAANANHLGADRNAGDFNRLDRTAIRSRDIYVRFSQQDADRVGFVSTDVSLEYLEYLLSGHVEGEDEAAAEMVEELVARYSV